jgi:acyl carrier protein
MVELAMDIECDLCVSVNIEEMEACEKVSDVVKYIETLKGE